MYEYAEDLPGPSLPVCAETYLAEQRTWHRLLRETGAAETEGRDNAVRTYWNSHRWVSLI